ncbi:MAG: prolyl-tRNA synthetase associated domain-containing protein [Pseudolabrys sp.]|nr:prolyl-tRNA synthetase associated domain-containing protein [Pseudolabrys sp.]
MATTPEQLFAYLDQLGIAHETVKHPALFTVEQSRALRGLIHGGHSKNLFLRDKNGALFLVTAPEDAVIDLKTLHHKLGAGRFSFGAANLMRDVLGVEPGAVTPFGVINDTELRCTVVVDAALLDYATLNFHPLVNTMTTSIGREDLLKFIESTGHRPRIERISSRNAAVS